jgi:hypothetical protein
MDQVVDGAARARLMAIKRELREGEARAAGELWRRGMLLLEVQRDELWRADGAASFEGWLVEELELEQVQAWRAATIARHFTEEMAARYGVRKLLATVSYLQATKLDEQPGDVQALTFRVRGPDGRYGKVAFARATARDIEEATRDLRANQRLRLANAREKALPGDLKAQAERLAASLPKAPSGRGPSVKVAARKDGSVVVDLKAVPLEGMREAIAALTVWMDEVEGGEG